MWKNRIDIVCNIWQKSLISSSRIENGWVVDSNSELLFWVPPQIHAGLMLREGDIVIGRMPKTRLDLTSFVYGKAWPSCKR